MSETEERSQCPGMVEVTREKCGLEPELECWMALGQTGGTNWYGQDTAKRIQVVCSRDRDQQFILFSVTLYFGVLSHISSQEVTLLSFTSPAKLWDRWPSVKLDELLLCVNHC